METGRERSRRPRQKGGKYPNPRRGWWWYEVKKGCKENADMRRSKCQLRHASLFVNLKVSDPYTRPLPSYSLHCRLSCSLSYGLNVCTLKRASGIASNVSYIMLHLVPCEVTVYSQPLRRLSRATSLFSRLHSGPVASCMMSTTQETISPVTQGSPWMALVALWRSL